MIPDDPFKGLPTSPPTPLERVFTAHPALASVMAVGMALAVGLLVTRPLWC